LIFSLVQFVDELIELQRSRSKVTVFRFFIYQESQKKKGEKN